MNSFKDLLLKIVHIIWGFPQNLIGFFIFLFCVLQKNKIYHYKNDILVEWDFDYGLSLGMFIFVWSHNNQQVIKHEYGHSIQSLILGPLYLLVIGLPSMIWCHCFGKYRAKNNISYYSFYPEAWANKLGEVTDLK